MYMPLQWASAASAYCAHVFGPVTLENCRHAQIYASQSKEVVNKVIQDLKNPVPRIRLILCTSAIGMGFDANTITRVIHTKPPRNLSDYFQEISRAGRAGQPARAILHFSPADIAHNLKGIKPDIIEYCKSDGCLRSSILRTYGFEKDAQSPLGCKCCTPCQELCDCDTCFAKLIEPMDTD